MVWTQYDSKGRLMYEEIGRTWWEWEPNLNWGLDNPTANRDILYTGDHYRQQMSTGNIFNRARYTFKYLDWYNYNLKMLKPVGYVGQAFAGALPPTWAMNYQAFFDSRGQNDMWGNELNTFGQGVLLFAPFIYPQYSILIDILGLGKKQSK
jgi:hypothetical protein